MTDKPALLVGELLSGNISHQMAFTLTANLTEYLATNRLLDAYGEPNLEAYFLQMTPGGRVLPVEGMRIRPVRISAIGIMLAGLLIGRLPPAWPTAQHEHAIWWRCVMSDLRAVLSECEAEWRVQVLCLLGMMLEWDASQHPSAIELHRECINLSLSEPSRPAASPAASSLEVVFTDEDSAMAAALTEEVSRPRRRYSLRSLGVALLGGLVLLTFSGFSGFSASASDELELVVKAAPNSSVVIDGIEQLGSEISVLLPAGSHHLSLQSGERGLSSFTRLTADTTCTWEPEGSVPWRCETS